MNSIKNELVNNQSTFVLVAKIPLIINLHNGKVILLSELASLSHLYNDVYWRYDISKDS